MRLILVIILPLIIRCWWDVGHMLTAAIAQIKVSQMDPFASVHFRELVTSINQLVDQRSRTFIQSACWPDDIKSKPYNMQLFNPWHFKDSPYVYDTVTPVINYTETVVSSVQVLKTAEKVLKMNLLNNTAERALFARYLVHLVGDIHQPLHSVALFNQTYPKGDLGGNAQKVILINGSTSNFHSYWDAGAYIIQNDSWFIVRPMNTQNLTALKTVANSYLKQYEAEVADLGKQINPLVWAQQSFRIAQNTTYPFIYKTNQLDKNYTMLTYQTSKKRITLAGLRLANYIIDIYKRGGQDHMIAKKPQMDTQQTWKYLMQDSKRVHAKSLIEQ